MKLGTYKEGKYDVTYCADGTIWHIIPSPFNTNTSLEKRDSLPEGYKYPEPEYKPLLGEAKLEIWDFSTTPVTIISSERLLTYE